MPKPRGSPRPRHKRLGVVSFNTWVIIVNVAVFVLNNVVLVGTTTRSGWGTVWDRRVSEPERARSVIDQRQVRQYPGLPGVMHHPVYLLEDELGRPLVDPLTGATPEVGRARFSDRPIVEAAGHFSTGKAFSELQVWRFVTFQFLHANLVHLLFNMLGLWFVGGMVESYLGRRRYAAFYLMCGCAGALMYLVLNLAGYFVSAGTAVQIPALLVSDVYTPLVGASAGVFGVLMAAAYMNPREVVLVLYIVPMQLRTAVYIFFGIATLNLLIGGSNAGGDAAHVGGALCGAYFIRRSDLLRAIVEWFRTRLPIWAGGTGSEYRVPGRAIVERSRIAGPTMSAELDRIFAKAREDGAESLSQEERELLRRASRELDAG